MGLTYWVTAIICLSVQMFKYPNIWMFQTAAKSLPNLKICILFCLNLEKKPTCCFLSKFHFYSDLRQISKHPNLTHKFSYIRWLIPTIHQLTSYFPGHLWESETRTTNRAISLVKLLPKYPSTRWKWEFGTIWMKNNFDTKLRRPFQIAAKFVPNRKFGRRYLNIWTNRRIMAVTHWVTPVIVYLV